MRVKISTDNDGELQVKEETGILVPAWLIIVIVIAIAGAAFSPKAETVGHLTCYDNLITGRQYCE